MSEERNNGKGHLDQGNWVRASFLFILELFLCKQEEGGSFACGIKNGNKVFFRHAEDFATFVMTSCYLFFLENC